MRRHKIDILKLTSTVDPDGFSVQSWLPITETKIWVDVLDLGSKEFYSASADQREHIIRCNIAYRNDVNEGMRIIWKEKTYQIDRIYQGDYRKNFLDLDAKLVEGVVD